MAWVESHLGCLYYTIFTDKCLLYIDILFLEYDNKIISYKKYSSANKKADSFVLNGPAFLHLPLQNQVQVLLNS